MPQQGIIPVILPVHILAGGLALLFGYTALFAAKGATVHRKTGVLFVGAMVVMSLSGALIATLNGTDISVVAGLLIQGPRRIARHLWRMCFAMRVAAASFFWGPRGRVPEIIDIQVLKAIAVLLPVAAIVYWLWWICFRRTLSGLVRINAPHTTALRES
jgi:hypothetical protein